MRIDAHAYVGHWPFRPLRGTSCSALVQRMDRFNIDRAFVGNLNGIFYKNTQAANEELFEACDSYRDRLVPFAVLNPTYAGWNRDLETCATQYGMAGVRLYPNYHDYAFASSTLEDAVRRIRDRGLIVSFTCRLVDRRQRSWLDLAEDIPLIQIVELIERIPDARYLILHAFADDFADPAIFERVDRTKIVFDMIYGTATGQIGPHLYDLPKAMRALGPERFAFGTATPFRDLESHILRMELLTSDASIRRHVDSVWGRNALALLHDRLADRRETVQ